MYRGDENKYYQDLYAKKHSSEAPEKQAQQSLGRSSIIRTMTVGSGVSPDLLTLAT
jgi:hypothetical protein